MEERADSEREAMRSKRNTRTYKLRQEMSKGTNCSTGQQKLHILWQRAIALLTVIVRK